jgi:hypothetical protein
MHGWNLFSDSREEEKDRGIFIITKHDVCVHAWMDGMHGAYVWMHAFIHERHAWMHAWNCFPTYREEEKGSGIFIITKLYACRYAWCYMMDGCVQHMGGCMHSRMDDMVGCMHAWIELFSDI